MQGCARLDQIGFVGVDDLQHFPGIDIFEFVEHKVSEVMVDFPEDIALPKALDLERGLMTELC
jgi:hypothetical protein